MKLFRRRRRIDLIFLGGLFTVIAILGWGSYLRAHQNALDWGLVEAAYRGRFAAANDLLQSGANPNASTERSGHKPLTLLDHIKALFEHDSGKKRETALQWAIGNGHMDVAKLLLGKGATGVNALDPARIFKGEHLLHSAVRSGDPYLVAALLDRGADINVRDWIKDTPLHYAVSWKKPEMLKLLLERGADPNAEDVQHRTVLQNALFATPRPVIGVLIDHGADVNKKCQSGARPLFYAIQLGRASTVELLVRKGADVNARGRLGKTTALAYARQLKRKDVIGILESAGARL